MLRRTLTLVIASLLGACGAASTPAARVAQAEPLDPATWLREIGGEVTPALRAPILSLEDLDEQRRAARGSERRALTRDYAIGLLVAAESSEGREARRHRDRMNRMLDATVRGTRDATLLAEVDLIRLWDAWRTESRSAPSRAERFTRRHRSVAGLIGLGWMIRGEVALGAEEWDDAIAHFRFALGAPGTPLYAYALLRTAAAHRGAGQTDAADQALGEVEGLGCDADALEPVRRLAAVAAAERGTGMRDDADGVRRPRSCPEHDANAEPEGWRPEE